MLENGKGVSYENRKDPPAPGAVLRVAGRVRAEGGAGRLGGL